MNYIDKATVIIKEFEGLRLHWYKCQAGKDTVGYGHVIQAGENELYEPITKSKAEELLKRDVEYMVQKISKYIKVALNDNQLAAVISFVFNVGPAAFKGSTMLKLINSLKFTEACKEFTKWCYVKGKVSRGLLNRRKREAALFSTEV